MGLINVSMVRRGVFAGLIALAALAARSPCVPAARTRADGRLPRPGVPVAGNTDVFWDDMTALRGKIVRYDVYWNEIAPTRPEQAARPERSPEYNWENARPPGADSAAHGADSRADALAHADLGPRRRRPRRQARACTRWRRASRLARLRVRRGRPLLRQVRPRRPEGRLTPLPLVSNWEMWNEPNYIGALRPQRKAGNAVSPAIYTGILNTGYAEIARRRARAQDQAGRARRRHEPRLRRRRAAIPAADLPARHEEGEGEVRHREPAPVPDHRPRRLERRHAGAEHHAAPTYGDYQKELDKLWPAKRYKVWLTEYGAAVEARPLRRVADGPGELRHARR